MTGKPELLTGKRYRAHNDNDPGAHDPAGLYYYGWNGKSFVKTTISYGPLGQGTGIYFDTADLRGTGRPDIVVAGEDGLWVFSTKGGNKNLRQECVTNLTRIPAGGSTKEGDPALRRRCFYLPSMSIVTCCTVLSQSFPVDCSDLKRAT